MKKNQIQTPVAKGKGNIKIKGKIILALVCPVCLPNTLYSKKVKLGG